MATILDDIVARTRADLAERKRTRPIGELRDALADAPPVRDFAAALDPALAAGPPVRLIAEVKRASPSAGVIRPEFAPVDVARIYERYGAACVSVLTDGPFFRGSLDDLVAVRRAVGLPVLRKDFVVDPYQVTEARAAGADAVLLIAECLPGDALADLFARVRAHGMHALVELYDPENLDRVLDLDPPLVGVNNRDLRDFRVDLGHSLDLVTRVPAGVRFVSESGIKTRADVERLAAAGVSAVLVGETLMRADDTGAAVEALIGRSSAAERRG